MRRKRDKGNKIGKFMVYFMGFIMIGSLFGIIFLGFGGGGGATSKVTYNGFEFVNRGTFWTTEIGGIPLAITFLPTDLELILVDNLAIERLKNKVQIDITSDFNDTFAEGIALAQFQVVPELNKFNIFLRTGFTTTQNNFPILTCDDATATVPIIYFKSANFTKISLDDNCIIAESSSQADVIKVKDRIVYGMFGIIR